MHSNLRPNKKIFLTRSRQFMVGYVQTHKLYESITIYYFWSPCSNAQCRTEHYCNSDTMEYITRIMRTHHALLCFVGVRYQSILYLSFKITSLTQGYSYDFSRTSELTPKNIG